MTNKKANDPNGLKGAYIYTVGLGHIGLALKIIKSYKFVLKTVFIFKGLGAVSAHNTLLTEIKMRPNVLKTL